MYLEPGAWDNIREVLPELSREAPFSLREKIVDALRDLGSWSHFKRYVDVGSRYLFWRLKQTFRGASG